MSTPRSPRIRRPRIRTLLPAAGLLAATLLVAGSARAGGRYERGRTLYRIHCATCLGLWQWVPKNLDPERPPNLQQMAKGWSARQVCTWMRKKTRDIKGHGCYPGRVSTRDRLDMLYYVYRRATGPIQKPKLGRSTLKLYRGPTLLRTLEALRRTALQRYRNRMLLRRMRQRSRQRFGTRRGQRVDPRRATPRPAPPSPRSRR